jgi:hypothetical protein
LEGKPLSAVLKEKNKTLPKSVEFEKQSSQKVQIGKTSNHGVGVRTEGLSLFRVRVCTLFVIQKKVMHSLASTRVG